MSWDPFRKLSKAEQEATVALFRSVCPTCGRPIRKGARILPIESRAGRVRAMLPGLEQPSGWKHATC